MRWVLLTAALLAALAGCGSSHGLELTPELEQLLALINEQRAEGYECASGYQPPVGPLTDDGRLNWAAQMHAEDMDAAGVLSHDTPPGAVHFAPGTSPGERIVQSGYLAAAWGENVAMGYATSEDVLNGWLASTDGHCEGLMSSSYQDAGLGHSGDYWVLDMARSQ